MPLPLIITLSVLGALLLLFCIYLFLIMPTFSRKTQIKEFAKHKYAHRGLHGDGAAENSMTAFRRAVEAGYGIELDVRLSSDGELVVFHDATLDRVTGVCARVDEKTYAELSEIRLADTEDTVPLFTDVLKAVDGRVPLLVELKEDAGKYCVTEKTLEILKSYSGPYIVESFNPLALGLVRKKNPAILRGVLSMDYLKEKKYRKPMYFILQNLVLNVTARPDFIAYNHKQYRNAAFRLCRALFRVTTFAWTLRTPEEEAAATLHGFDGIIFENYRSEQNI